MKDSNQSKVFRKTNKQEQKELSSREKAKLFAKNIPKPKPKKSGSGEDDGDVRFAYDSDGNQAGMYGGLNQQPKDPNMLTQVIENPDDENNFTMTEKNKDKLMPYRDESKITVNGGGGQNVDTLFDLNQKHEEYADEIEKIKAMLM